MRQMDAVAQVVAPHAWRARAAPEEATTLPRAPPFLEQRLANARGHEWREAREQFRWGRQHRVREERRRARVACARGGVRGRQRSRAPAVKSSADRRRGPE